MFSAPRTHFSHFIAGFLTMAVCGSAAQAKPYLDNPQAPLSITKYKVFSDEFDWAPPAAPEGLDERDPRLPVTKWRTSGWSTGGKGRIGGGQTYYADSGQKSWQYASVVPYNPFSVRGGVLSITAKPQEVPYSERLKFASGILTSVQSFYIDNGYFEIRLKCPAANGTISKFALTPAAEFYNQAASPSWELDLLQAPGAEPGRIHLTAKTNDPEKSELNIDVPIESGPVSDGFHVYGFDKQPGKVDVYRDGGLLQSVNLPNGMAGPVSLGLALDVGQDGGPAGTPVAADFPQSLEIDYLRVYKTKFTKIIGGPFAGLKMGLVLTPIRPSPGS